MMMTEYETTVIIRPDISGDEVESTLDRVRDSVSKQGGKLLAINHWGKKKLAYEIKKHTRGIYVNTSFLGGNDLIAELERNLRISDNVLRYLTIQIHKDVNPADRDVADYQVPEYNAEEPEEEEDEPFSAGGYDDNGRDDRRGERSSAAAGERDRTPSGSDDTAAKAASDDSSPEGKRVGSKDEDEAQS